MDLLPEEVKKTLPALYSQDGLGDNAIVYIKFFHPFSHWYWFATEGSPVDADGYYDTDKPKVDFLFFGYVWGDFPEFGYFSLSEMEAINVGGLPMERDLYFKPKRLSEVKAELMR